MSIEKIELGVCGIVVIVKDGRYSIEDDLHEKIDYRYEEQYIIDAMELHNSKIDTANLLILAHVIAGVNITAPAYIRGVESVYSLIVYEHPL